MSDNPSVRDIESFGEVAAEDDPVLEYFLTTDAVTRIASNDALLVLGRKGSGKTAIVRHFAEASDTTSRAVNLRSYPWKVHASRRDQGASDIETYVASWRFLIATELAALSLQVSDLKDGEPAKSVAKFLKDNYGAADPNLGDILRPDRLRVESLSFEPAVLGNKLGGVSLKRGFRDIGLGRDLDALSDSLLGAVMEMVEQSDASSLLLHFDELDQGLSQLTDGRSEMLVGLVLAARAVRRFFAQAPIPVGPVIYLRSDLWEEIDFSDKNKIAQTLAIGLEWGSDALLDLVNRRIEARLGEGVGWRQICDEGLMRGSQTKWNHILARTFLRPRDVIAFLNAALRIAKTRADERLVFRNEDITEARDRYSPYLKEELDDEILAHWRHWDDALQACSAISTLTFDRDEFIEQYEKRRSVNNDVAAADALRHLYEFSVVGYQRRSGYGGSSWAFRYSDPEAGWDSSATRFKVHLGLKEYAKLKEERR